MIGFTSSDNVNEHCNLSDITSSIFSNATLTLSSKYSLIKRKISFLDNPISLSADFETLKYNTIKDMNYTFSLLIYEKVFKI